MIDKSKGANFIKIVCVFWDKDRYEALKDNMKAQGVASVLASREGPAALSEVIRGALLEDKIEVSNIATFLVGKLNIVETDVSQVGAKAGNLAYAVLNDTRADKAIDIARINLAGLLVSIAYRGAFVGLGYNPNDSLINKLMRSGFFGFFRIMPIDVARETAKFFNAMKETAVSL